MKCRNTICWQVHEISYQRNILGFQRIPPRAEQVQSQPIPKEKRFLRFMHNKLRVCVKVLARVFPNKSAVVSSYLITSTILGMIVSPSASLCSFLNHSTILGVRPQHFLFICHKICFCTRPSFISDKNLSLI